VQISTQLIHTEETRRGMCKMVVKGKHNAKKIEKAADGKEVHQEETQDPLVSQAKTPKRKFGNEEKVQALLWMMRNMNITLPVVTTLEHNHS